MFDKYSGDETFALFVSAVVALLSWGNWYYTLAVTGRQVRARGPRWPLALAPFLGAVYPVLTTAFILGTLTAVNLLIVLLVPALGRKAERLRDAWLPLLLAFGLSWFEIVLSALIKFALIALAGQGS